jgi:hypothetical protein
MDDLGEKNHQVQRMRDIFRLSSRVLIWLGPASEDNLLAFQTLAYINSKIQIDWASGRVKAVSNDSTDWAAQASRIPLGPGAFLAISNLLQRPLFNRIWAWQEVHLASDLSIVIAGHDSIPLPHFRNAIWYLAWKRVYDSTDTIDEYSRMRESLLTVLGMVDKVPDKSLRSLIERTRNCSCSDPRDRIYALLGLTDTPDLIVPNYSKSVVQVYLKVVLQHINKLGDMNILSSCEPSNQPYDWPTWVPDWSTPSQCSQQFSSLNAAGDTYPEAKYIGHDILEVCGVNIGKVDITFSLPTAEATDMEMIPIIKDLMMPAGKNGKGKPSPEAGYRVMCGNRFSDRYMPPRESLLNPQQSNEAVSELLNSPVNRSPGSLRLHETQFLREFQTMARGRCLFTTTNGFLGLGLRQVRPNDTVWVLLGCSTPMILRSSDTGHFEIIGAAYLDGFSEAQALLGPLPDAFSFVYQYNDTTKSYQAAYLDAKTGATTLDDPRLEPLPPGWRVMRYPEENAQGVYERTAIAVQDDSRKTRTWKHSGDPRLTPEALMKRGVELQTFRLI